MKAAANPVAWKRYASCADMDLRIFYTERGESPREAKNVCAGCPVREECLEYALVYGEKFGIWGGKSERQRKRMRAERRGPPSPSVCGTEAGYRRHLRLHNKTCPECRQAHQTAVTNWREENSA